MEKIWETLTALPHSSPHLYPRLAVWTGTACDTGRVFWSRQHSQHWWGALWSRDMSPAQESHCSAAAQLLTGPERVSKWAVCKKLFQMAPPFSLKWFSSWALFRFPCYLSSIMLHTQLYFAFRLLLMPDSSWAWGVGWLLIEGRSCSRGSDWHII